MSKQHFGFTIVELVVVIILLGILAATALPRFMNIDDHAHQAAFEGVAGAMQTGVSVFHAQYIAEQSPPAGHQFADFNDLRSNANGYPFGLTNRASGDVTDSTDCSMVFSNVLQVGAPSVQNANNVNQARTRSDGNDYVAMFDGTDCIYYYTAIRPAPGETTWVMRYNSSTGLITQEQEAFP